MQAVYALADEVSAVSLDSLELVLRVRSFQLMQLIWVTVLSAGNMAISWPFGQTANTSEIENSNRNQSGRSFCHLFELLFSTYQSLADYIKRRKWRSRWSFRWKVHCRIANSRIYFCVNFSWKFSSAWGRHAMKNTCLHSRYRIYVLHTFCSPGIECACFLAALASSMFFCHSGTTSIHSCLQKSQSA